MIPFRRPSRPSRFEKLVQPHLDAMYRFAFRLSGQQQDAEDLVQDVVVKLYPRLEELESIDQLRPWLNRVLYRQFIDSVRRKGRQADSPMSSFEFSDAESWIDAQPADLPDITERLDSDRMRAMLENALSDLSPDQRTLLLLCEVDGWNQEDIAAVLDIPLGTVKSRLHRCRAALRKKLQETPEPSAETRRVDR
nr:RNA polymerase sigma factor [Marinobacter halotolerans]